MNRWYVVQTHARRENQAVDNLKRQSFQTYLPRYLKRRRHARRVDWRQVPVFPGYLFVRFDSDLHRWRAIQSTVGVSKLIMFGEIPISVPYGIVEAIKSREDERGMVGLFPDVKLSRGDTVQVVDGALSELDGIFDCVDDKQRAFVFLELLGRKVKVRLPIEALHAFV